MNIIYENKNTGKLIQTFIVDGDHVNFCKTNKIEEFIFLDDVDVDLKYMDLFDIMNGKIIINLEKARTKKIESLRANRNRKLKDLDIPTMIAFEQGKKTEYEKLINQKQQLRDLPESIDLSPFNDIESLDSYVPDLLK